MLFSLCQEILQHPLTGLTLMHPSDSDQASLLQDSKLPPKSEFFFLYALIKLWCFPFKHLPQSVNKYYCDYLINLFLPLVCKHHRSINHKENCWLTEHLQHLAWGCVQSKQSQMYLLNKWMNAWMRTFWDVTLCLRVISCPDYAVLVDSSD